MMFGNTDNPMGDLMMRMVTPGDPMHMFKNDSPKKPEPTPVVDSYADCLGWCGGAKRLATLEMLEREKPSRVVELGTFGGSWLVPVAVAAPYAECFAVDPYSAGAALEGMTTEVSRKWWSNEQMLREVKASFLKAVEVRGLKNVTLLEMTSEQAVSRFEDGSLGCVHSDANHSLEPTLRDARLWLPKLRVGGVFIQDDKNWCETFGGVATFTVRPTIEWLLANHCQVICEVDESIFFRKVR